MYGRGEIQFERSRRSPKANGLSTGFREQVGLAPESRACFRLLGLFGEGLLVFPFMLFKQLLGQVLAQPIDVDVIAFSTQSPDVDTRGQLVDSTNWLESENRLSFARSFLQQLVL